MTPAELLERAEAAGLDVEVEGGKTLVIRGPAEPFRRYVPQFERAKPEILKLLAERERRAAAERLDNLRAARDIRERRWTRAPAPCAFYCGPPGATCWRCGGAWLEHQATPPTSELAIAAPSQCEA